MTPFSAPTRSEATDPNGSLDSRREAATKCIGYLRAYRRCSAGCAPGRLDMIDVSRFRIIACADGGFIVMDTGRHGQAVSLADEAEVLHTAPTWSATSKSERRLVGAERALQPHRLPVPDAPRAGRFAPPPATGWMLRLAVRTGLAKVGTRAADKPC